MHRRFVNYLIVSAIYCFYFIHDASAASCRWFGREAQAAIKSHVAALQRFEHEAADRLNGLDSRPFEFLLGEARKATAIIADPIWLKDEEDLERCRNATFPIRKICAAAAQMLVEVLEKHVVAPKPEYEKAKYADAMSKCEKLMDLKPLKSAIRGTD